MTSRLQQEAKTELMVAIWGVCLFHTNLQTMADESITCSDASSTGGAHANHLTGLGEAMLASY